MQIKIFNSLRKNFNFILFVLKNFKFFLDKLILIFRSKFFNRKIFYEYEEIKQYDEVTNKFINEINKRTQKNYDEFAKNKSNILDWYESQKSVISEVNKVFDYKINDKIDIENLNKFGFQKFSKINLNSDVIKKIIEEFMQKKIYPAHVPIFSLKPKDKFDKIKKSSPFGTYDQLDIIKNPILFRIITDNEILDYAIKYFGCVPTLSNINLYWSFKSDKKSGPQNYHRDIDDYKILNVFMNLTDTSFDNGSYEHIKHTHDYEFIKKDIPSDSKLKDEIDHFFNINYNGYGNDFYLEDSYFSNKIEQIHGKAGTICFANGFGLHRAVLPKENDRLILWMTFGIKQTSHEKTKNKYQKRIKFNDIEINDFKKNLINKYVYRHIIDFSNEKN